MIFCKIINNKKPNTQNSKNFRKSWPIFAGHFCPITINPGVWCFPCKCFMYAVKNKQTNKQTGKQTNKNKTNKTQNNKTTASKLETDLKLRFEFDYEVKNISRVPKLPLPTQLVGVPPRHDFIHLFIHSIRSHASRSTKSQFPSDKID